MRGARPINYLLIAALLLLTGALVWAGCGSGGSTTNATGALTGTQPFVASGQPTGGTDGTSTVVGDLTQVRAATASYKIEASDPRLGGTSDVIYNMDQAADGSGKMWGTWIVTGTEGTWVSDAWSGYHAANGDTFVYGQSKGTGKYAGLVSYWQWYWSTSYAGSYQGTAPGMAVSGWIQKAK